MRQATGHGRQAWRWLLAAALLALAFAPGRFTSGAHAAAGGTAHAWGDNSVGQLGNGTSGAGTGSAVPVTVSGTGPGGIALTTTAAGKSHNLGLTADGTAYAWGYNQYGQLGNGTSPLPINVPVMVSGTGPGGVALVAVDGGANHSLGLAANGTAYAWGDNQYGQLGSGSVGSNSTVPMAVPGTGPGGIVLTGIASGDRHNLALAANGTAYAWGFNEDGQLGNGASGIGVNSAAPVAVSGTGPGGIALVAIAGGYGHSLGVTANGTAYAWGRNDYGQLGNNNRPNGSTVPVTVAGTGPGGVALTAIATGGYHSLGIAANGTAYGWGYNQYGQVGNGASGVGAFSAVPVAVTGTGPGGIVLTAIAAGFYHSLALTANGTGYGWGANFFGYLGNGSTSTATAVPTQVSGTGPGGLVLTGIDGGILHSVAGTGTATAPCNGRFADVPAGDAACVAIATLVDRGVIKGYDTVPPTFGTNDPVQRAQVAAFLVRALGWQGRPTGPRTFTDFDGLVAELRTASLIIANACDAQGNCVARGPGDGTFGPTEPVTRAQVITFIVRAFTLEPKYAWQSQPGASQPYGGVPAVHDIDIRTYVVYAGAIPDAPGTANDWNGAASRAWVARVLYQALQTKP